MLDELEFDLFGWIPVYLVRIIGKHTEKVESLIRADQIIRFDRVHLREVQLSNEEKRQHGFDPGTKTFVIATSDESSEDPTIERRIRLHDAFGNTYLPTDAVLPEFGKFWLKHFKES